MTTKSLTNHGPLDLRDLVEMIPALVVCVSPDGSVEFVNRAWQEYTGLSVQQLKESGWQNAIYAEDLAGFTHDGSIAFSAQSPLSETEARVRRADGQYRWFAVKKTLSVLRSGNSKPSLYTLVAFEDINERKQSQIELQQSETRYRALIETASDAVISADESGTITFANPSTMRIFGYAPLEVVGKSLTVLMPESVRHAHANGFRRFLSTGQKQLNWRGAELVGLRKNGQEFPIAVSLGELTRGGQRVFTAFIRDLSEQKRTEAVLRRNESSLAQAQKLAGIGILAWKAPGREALYLSDGWYRIYGFDPRHGVPTWKTVLERVHPDDRAKVEATSDRANAEKSDYDVEFRILVPGAPLKFLHAVAEPVLDASGELLQFVGVVMDVTESRQAEGALREQASLLSLTHDAILVCDLNGILKYWNRGAQELYGWTAEEAIGKLTHGLLRTLFPTSLEQITAEVLSKGRWESELVQTKKDGEQIVTASRWSLQRDEKGSPIGFLETNNDITERKRAEEALIRSESYLAQAQRLAHIGSWAFEVPAKKLLYLSDEWYRVFGFDPKDGMPTWQQRVQRLHPDDRAQNQAAINRAIDEKSDFEVEFRILLPNSAVRQIHSAGHPVLDSSGDVIQFVGVAMDVTASKQAEKERERLVRAQAELAHMNRVSTLGELTASLAHEIKQPIGAAVTNGEACVRLLDRDQPDIPEAREAALEMVKDARRAADIIDRVRSLYQKGSSELDVVDVNEIIREMVIMLQNEANRHSVTIHTDLAARLPKAMADRVQLQQALMNLMLNSIEAMQDTSGILSVKSQLADGGQLLISVADTGVGLPADNINKIFDAFFTTKSQGTGLGLAITRSIVTSHGGRIWATANSGRGATFHFTLPSIVAVAA